MSEVRQISQLDIQSITVGLWNPYFQVYHIPLVLSTASNSFLLKNHTNFQVKVSLTYNHLSNENGKMRNSQKKYCIFVKNDV